MKTNTLLFHNQNLEHTEHQGNFLPIGRVREQKTFIFRMSRNFEKSAAGTYSRPMARIMIVFSSDSFFNNYY